MKNLRAFSLWALAGALSCSIATAQSAAPGVRVVSRIDESNLVTLRGNVNPNAIAKNDRGPVSSDFALPDLTLVLSRSAQQQAAFDAFVASQYDPSSPNFHQWLTPEQIGQQFGPAQADIDAITSWLTSHGFTVNMVSPDRMTIRFAGTAGQVQSAFHTEIHRLDVNGVAHYANMTDPQIPAALAPVVLGVKALHNFLPHPLHRLGSAVQFNPQTGKWQRITNSSLSSGLTHSPSFPASLGAGTQPPSAAHPMFGINNYANDGGLEEDVAPYDFATIYNLPSGWPNTNNGSGQTIAIAGTSEICLGQSGSPCNGANDVATFRSAFGLPAGSTPNQIDAGSYFHTGTTASVCTSTSSTAACGIGDLTENSLDVEWAGAVASGAQIDLVVTGQSASCNTSTGAGCIDTVYDSAAYVVDNVTAKILSVSYGECELYEGTAGNVAYYDLWQQAAAEGISVFVATGDSGAPACDDGMDSSYGTPYLAQYGLSVNGLASTPFDTAVGGTDFSWCQPYYYTSGSNIDLGGCASSSTSQGSPAYWNTSNNSTTQASAAGYVPEIPWNDTCENPILARYVETLLSTTGADSYFGINPTTPEESCSIIYQGYVQLYEYFDNEFGVQIDLSGFVDTVGGSGGASNCVASTATSTTDTCNAGATSTGATTNPNTGAQQASLTLNNDGWPKPSWQTGVSGIPSDGVRDIPDVSFFAGNGALNSATVICVSLAGGSCTSLGANNTGLTATGAYEVGGTSVASPEMAGVMALINQKAGSAQGLAAPNLYKLAAAQNYSNCSAETVTSSSSCYFQDIDNGPTASSGPAYTTAQTIAMPCNLVNGSPEGGDGGTEGQGVASPNCTALNMGDSPVGTLTGYNSAAGYDLATGLGSLNVANVVTNWPVTAVTGTGTTTVTVSTGGVTTLNSNVALNVTVAVAAVSPAGTPTGTVTLKAGTFTSTQTIGTSPCNSAASCTFTIPANTFTASGSVAITASYSGDSTYAANANSNTVTVTVTYIAPPTYSLATPTNPQPINPGGTATVTISGATSSSGYTGTVSFTGCALTSSSVTNPNDPPSCMLSSGTITYTAGVPSGTVTATVTTTAGVAKLAYPKLGNGKGWMGAGGGAVLAFLVLLGIPARRRSWRAMLGMVVLLVMLGSLAACGGGGSSGGGTTVNISGTSAGTYTFTVTSSGNPAVSPAPTTTFTVTVN